MFLSFEERFLDFIRKYDLFGQGERVVVAVSGGPDSVCLLHLLYRFKDMLGVKLHVAHLDHMLRGPDSRADADYVGELAKGLGIPLTAIQRDVASYQREEGLTLEQAAREVRYAFLGGVAEEVGASSVAVGHTQTDQVETVLMHLVRGSGLKGLVGLRPCSPFPVYSATDCTLVRPLLTFSREDTRDYCLKEGLMAREDATNLSIEPLRNRVRLELLPQLRRYNPRFDEAIVRLSRLAGDDYSLVSGLAAQIKQEIISYDKGSLIIDRRGFDGLHKALKRHIIQSVLYELRGGVQGIEAVHVESVMEFLCHPTGESLDVGGGVVVTIDYDGYRFSRGEWGYCPYPELEGGMLNLPGETVISGWKVSANIIAPECVPAAALTQGADPFTCYLDYGRVALPLMVRAQVSGDRFWPLGGPGVKKLSRFMTDAKIPQRYRGRIPVVVGADGSVVWFVGYRIDERFKVTPESSEVLRLTFKCLTY